MEIVDARTEEAKGTRKKNVLIIKQDGEKIIDRLHPKHYNSFYTIFHRVGSLHNVMLFLNKVNFPT
jgi:hypothetical protein